jgi:ribose transport system substrate-binding protein
MKKKLMWLAVVLLGMSMVASFSLAGGKEGASSEGGKKLVFGNIPVAMSDEWNGYSVENFKYAADKKGVEVQVLDPAWDGTKALSNLEDLITKKVDSIAVFAFTPESAQKFIVLANEAGIPISFENTKLKDNPYSQVEITGDVLFNICEDYYGLGYEAIKYIGEHYPGARVFHVRGYPGMGIAEEMQAGVDGAVKEFGKVTADINRDTQWDTETAQKAVADVIQSGEEFDVIFSDNESMALGVHNALKDAGLDGKIPIIATNGGPTGIKMIQEGSLEATCAIPVSIQGLYMFKAMYLYATKGIKPPEEFILITTNVITKDNLDEIIPWQASDELIDLIGGLDSWDTPGIYQKQ